MRPPRQEDDEGATLILVLIFLTVFAVIIGTILGLTSTNLGATSVVQGTARTTYAADAGMEYAIQTLRQDDTFCADPSVTSTRTNVISLPNTGQVDVTCQLTTGQAAGAFGYALVTRSTTQSGITVDNPGDKVIRGPVFANKLDSGVQLTVNNGDVTVRETSGSCPAGFAFPVITPDPPYKGRCLNATAPDPAPAAGPVPTSTNLQGPFGEEVNGCRIFRPGLYTAIQLGSDNYFSSGRYWFVNTTIDVKNGRLFGGQPAIAGGELPRQSSNPACTTDDSRGDGGFGVKIILTGTSRLHVDQANGSAELYTRLGGDTAAEGAQGVSVMTSSSTLPSGTSAIQSDYGSGAFLAVHGLIYVPDSLIELGSVNNAKAALYAGVVCARLHLQSPNGAGPGVSTQVGAGSRRLTLTSHAVGINSRSVKVRAVIDIANDAGRTVTINSWSTTAV